MRGQVGETLATAEAAGAHKVLGCTGRGTVAVCQDADLGPPRCCGLARLDSETGVRIGRHEHVGSNAPVGHDTQLDDYRPYWLLAGTRG
ncbi:MULTISPECIES: hypothetical protein [unclassified Micromonospora]|uniref:hypothetical protein n=1 Tax=unclassified Micromonospora TaxID=2617518 RepID=UPI003A8AEDF5